MRPMTRLISLTVLHFVLISNLLIMILEDKLNLLTGFVVCSNSCNHSVLHLYLLIYIWDRTNIVRPNSLLYINNWEFNKKFEWGTIYAFILLFPLYFPTIMSLSCLYKYSLVLICHCFFIPIPFHFVYSTVFLSSPYGNIRSWSWHQILWHFLLLLSYMFLLLSLV